MKPDCKPRLHSGAALLFPMCFVVLMPNASAGDASAPPGPLTDTFQLALGSFSLDTDTQLRLDGDIGRGTPVDWERTFGHANTDRFRVDGYWRFADRHKLRAMWFNHAHSDVRNLDSEIQWGDVVYPVNAEVKSELDFDVYEAAYEYAFLKRETFELSATVGLHYTEFAAALEGEASAGSGGIAGGVREAASVDAPLPLVGLRGTWALPQHFSIDGSAQFFVLSLGDFDGDLRDYRVMVTWQPRNWFGLGLGYNRFEIGADVDASRFAGDIDWVYQGALVSYSVSF